MDHPAGKDAAADSSPTPWDSIDPNEPAGGPSHATLAVEDADVVAVYAADEPSPETIAALEPEIAQVEAAAPDVIEEVPAAIAEDLTPSVEGSVVDASAQEDVIAGAARNLANFDPGQSFQFNEPHVFHQEFPPSGGGGTSPVFQLEGHGRGARATHVPQTLSETSEPSPDAPTASKEATSESDSIVPARDDASEFFGDTIDALDALPDTMGAISDITEVVGEEPELIAQPQDVSEMEEAEEELAEAVFTDAHEEPEPVWEDPELEGELEPVGSGGGAWTIPLLCAGIGLIACCIVIPQADANRRMAYERMTLTTDLASIDRQVMVNDEFLKKVVDDPSLAERLAQRQLKRVRKGQHVLKLREEKTEMSPFEITAVSPPPAPPPYQPLGGVLATLCCNARSRLYLMGTALAMIASGLVLGVSPKRETE